MPTIPPSPINAARVKELVSPGYLNMHASPLAQGMGGRVQQAVRTTQAPKLANSWADVVHDDVKEPQGTFNRSLCLHQAAISGAGDKTGQELAEMLRDNVQAQTAIEGFNWVLEYPQISSQPYLKGHSTTLVKELTGVNPLS